MNVVTGKIILIPSYKFLQLLPQLTARLSENEDLISILLRKIAVDHPHHILGIIIALVNSNLDNPDK